MLCPLLVSVCLTQEELSVLLGVLKEASGTKNLGFADNFAQEVRWQFAQVSFIDIYFACLKH